MSGHYGVCYGDAQTIYVESGKAKLEGYGTGDPCAFHLPGRLDALRVLTADPFKRRCRLLNSLSESSPASGPIARATEQAHEAMRQRTLEQAPRQRLNRAITVVDAMIAMLERHNVKGTLPAPRAVESGINEVLRATDQLEISIGRGRSLKKVMDELFAVQQRLMAMRAGPGWEWAYADEENEPTDQRISQGAD